MDLMQLEDPIGTELELWGGKRTLVGIVDNVLMGSPYQEVKPLFMIGEDILHSELVKLMICLRD